MNDSPKASDVADAARTRATWTRDTLMPSAARSNPSACGAPRPCTQARLQDEASPKLGRLEDLACQLAAISRSTTPLIAKKAIVVMGADHGVAVEGVSAYPQEVTAQMMLNFARGGAAINVLARAADARICVVDMGVAGALPSMPAIRSARVADGTRNFMREPAMTEAQALAAIRTGYLLARELQGDGISLLGIGEMGIGNTTSASALTAVLTSTAPAEVTGLGTGIDQATRARKVEIIEQAIAKHSPDWRDPLGVLSMLGGFEIAGLVGVIWGPHMHTWQSSWTASSRARLRSWPHAWPSHWPAT